eukprot:16443567-Heterocapsa_arctica.AAC.1
MMHRCLGEGHAEDPDFVRLWERPDLDTDDEEDLDGVDDDGNDTTTPRDPSSSLQATLNAL